jgi:hypothetical protein
MAHYTANLAAWGEDGEAFNAALAGAAPLALEHGLVITERHYEAEGMVMSRGAAVHRSGEVEDRAALIVALDRDGGSVRQSTPGGAYRFTSFSPWSEAQYFTEFDRLIRAAAEP